MHHPCHPYRLRAPSPSSLAWSDCSRPALTHQRAACVLQVSSIDFQLPAPCLHHDCLAVLLPPSSQHLRRRPIPQSPFPPFPQRQVSLSTRLFTCRQVNTSRLRRRPRAPYRLPYVQEASIVYRLSEPHRLAPPVSLILWSFVSLVSQFCLKTRPESPFRALYRLASLSLSLCDRSCHRPSSRPRSAMLNHACPPVPQIQTSLILYPCVLRKP